jgi:methylenetetrahydrofolate--tRNA-(uracil-5-)-methyltransferase
MLRPVHVIGGGLAGSEAAWQLAARGIPVVLHEMRPIQTTPAHETDRLAELVCSNSFRADDSDANAVGLLHDEMRRCGSLILRMADRHKVPAGGALAVDREAFAKAVTEALETHPLITLRRAEITALPDAGPDDPEGWDNVIVASGPLTSPSLSAFIRDLTGAESFSFFDAIAPILFAESIDMSKAWRQSRYDKGVEEGSSGDYINCALDREQYETFVQGLLNAKKVEFKDWEKNAPYFDGCLPIEVMAARGPQTLRFGPMKPVGLTNPHKTERPYAVIQLRQDNALGTLYNIVGFQTKMLHAEQTRLFRTVPGLENAVFARLGGMHRNSYIDSPALLDRDLRLKNKRTEIRFAGQMTGVEGYVESAAMGLLAGLFAAASRLGKPVAPPPRTTALGALLNHLTGDPPPHGFHPMNVTFGLFPPLEEVLKGGRKGRPARKQAIAARAKEALGLWLSQDFLPASLPNDP